LHTKIKRPKTLGAVKEVLKTEFHSEGAAGGARDANEAEIAENATDVVGVTFSSSLDSAAPTLMSLTQRDTPRDS